MPRIHDPFPPTSRSSKGSAIPQRSIAKRARRRKKIIRPSPSLKQPPQDSSLENKSTAKDALALIGEDLLDFVCENQDSNEDNDGENNKLSTEQEATTSDPKTPAAQERPREEAAVVSIHKRSSNNTVEEEDLLQAPTPFRHALAIDSRFFETKDGERVAKQALTECSSFLRCLVERGVAPCIIACTQLEEPMSVKKTARAKKPILGVCSVRLTREHLDKLEQEETGDFLSLVPVRPPLNAENTKNRKAVHVPKSLLAHASWKLFGDLVESILREDTKHGGSKGEPLDITIMTNDVSFLLDTNETSHKRGVKTFWERLKPKFQNGKLGNLQIVMISTGTVVLTVDSEVFETDKDEHPVSESGTPMENGLEEAGASNEVTLASKRAIHLARCAGTIRTQIEALGEADFKANRSYLLFDSKPIPAVNMTLSSIDNNSVGFKSLLRKWSRDRMPGYRRICFDLPETLDGTQCSVSLDVMYKTMPFRLDSNVAKGLTRDLKLLSESKLEVLQLVPISLVDSSLIHGVVMGVRAGLETDLDRHNETALLVRSLFRHLSSKDCALLLRSEGPSNIESDGLFHCNGQSFLLMAEELPVPLKTKAAPNSGVLYRYASADQLLQEAIPADVMSDLDEDMANQYSEFVENSLDCLDCYAINPLHLEAKRPRSIANKSMTETALTTSVDDVDWTDTAGVGSREPPATQDFIPPAETQIQHNQPAARRPIAASDGLGLKTQSNPWTDDSGVGMRPSATEDSEEITDVEDSEKATKLKAKRVPAAKEVKGHKRASAKAKQKQPPDKKATPNKPMADEEAEWTDDSGLESLSSADSSTEDEDICAFDYSP